MENLDFKKLGLELKRLRTERAYTQEEIAKGLGCTVAFVSNLENNRAKLNLRVLIYYAKLCNVSVDSILSAGEKDPTTSISQQLDAELMHTFHQFPEEEQQKILKTLQFLLTC